MLLKIKQFSTAILGISARRMRRKAFAIEASIPTTEKVISYLFGWVWILMRRFWLGFNYVMGHVGGCDGLAYLLELVEVPRVVFTRPMPWEVVGTDICDCLFIDTDDLEVLLAGPFSWLTIRRSYLPPIQVGL